VTLPGTARPMVTVIGVGNRWRNDDGAGPEVVSRLGARWGDDPRVRLIELRGDVISVVHAWSTSDVVWIVDALEPASAPGTVAELDPDRLTDGQLFGGSHRAGVAEAIELSRALGRTPRGLRVLGIEGSDFAHGQRLGPEVSRAVGEVVAELDADLGRELCS
jgi:hydrogenase maturation protease